MVAKAAYKYSGAQDVVSCVTDPTLSSCGKAAATVALVVATGGEGEVEVAAIDAAEEAGADVAENAGADAAGDAAESCVTGGGESFTAQTKVLLASGVAVPIGQLKVGEKVSATNTKTGKTQAETVTAVLLHHDTDLYDLKVHAEGKTAVIDTTRNHLFWSPGTGGHAGRWVKAGALRYGTHLRTPGGGIASVLGGSTPRVTSGWMWDLTVHTDHDFYIQISASFALVHNDSCTDTVYRVLRPDEDPADGLFPKDPNAKASIDDHVRFGSKPGYVSQYISATKELDVARAWAAKSGSRIASIDLSQVPGEVTDLSTYENRDWYLLDAKGRGYAMKSEEVIIRGAIPPAAVGLVP